MLLHAITNAAAAGGESPCHVFVRFPVKGHPGFSRMMCVAFPVEDDQFSCWLAYVVLAFGVPGRKFFSEGTDTCSWGFPVEHTWFFIGSCGKEGSV